MKNLHRTVIGSPDTKGNRQTASVLIVHTDNQKHGHIIVRNGDATELVLWLNSDGTYEITTYSPRS